MKNLKTIDLKVNNWVSHFGEQLQIDLSIFYAMEGPGNYLLDFRKYRKEITRFEGIPLTPEILEKCGFVKCLFSKKDVYENEIDTKLNAGNNVPHISFKKAGFDSDIVLQDHVNTLERNIINSDELGQHGWYVSAQFERNKVGIAMCYELHQLQNLYYSLTGEELIYKP
jgi:hypothetical protein